MSEFEKAWGSASAIVKAFCWMQNARIKDDRPDGRRYFPGMQLHTAPKPRF